MDDETMKGGVLCNSALYQPRPSLGAQTSDSKAVNVGDAAAYQLPAMQRKVARALAEIERVTATHKVGVAFSTGKDSTVLLDLVRRVYPAVPTAYYHSGDETEFPQNLELCVHYDVPVLHTEQTLADLCRNYGYWGHPAEIETDTVDFGAFMIGEPAYRFATQNDLTCIALGLRSQESSGRAANARYRGTLYPVKFPGRPDFQHFTPLAHWTHDDVWAYITGRNLRYHPIYDAMAAVGIPRWEQRISLLLAAAFSHHGSYQHLRMVAPDQFRHLANQFPTLRRLA
jgi:3'-phosphoadenosine 5'-phosphosulfate sulfotransferase (PAPS reductase)/FAD synthetase